MAVGPSLKQLLIPHKTNKTAVKITSNKTVHAVTQPHYGDDMRAIETWAENIQNQISNIPTSLYASLTGPGETASPGDLTQNGGLAVNLGTSGSRTFSVNAGSSTYFSVTHTGTVTMGDPPAGTGIVVSVSTNTITQGIVNTTFQFTGGNVTFSVGGTWVINLGGFGHAIEATPVASGTLIGIGFYGATPVSKAAHPSTLADVITILTNLGLCS